MNITEQIRRAAQRRQLSVYRIAKDCGLDQSGLNKFFNGTKDVLTTPVVDILMDYLDLEVRPKQRYANKRRPMWRS
jgi:hypothetical protein